MAKAIKLRREVASAARGITGGAAKLGPWDAAAKRRTISRLARDLEKLKAKRKALRKQLDAIEDSITYTKRVYRDVISEAVEGSLDTGMFPPEGK